MIVVDTSVWIDYFNNLHTLETNALDDALDNDVVVIGDLILLEILQGFRSDKDYNSAKKHLSSLHQYNMLTPGLAISAAENYRELRKKGVTIRKTADLIIATFCLENRLPLLFSNKNFIPFVEYFKLRSIVES